MYCQAFYHTYGLQTVTIRYFRRCLSAAGPGQPLFRCDSAVHHGHGCGHPAQDLRLMDCSRVDFTSWRTWCTGILLAMDASLRRAGQCHQRGGRPRHQLLELIRGPLNDMLGTQVEPLFEPPRAGDVARAWPTSPGAQLLGYERPVVFHEGLRRS